MGVTELWEDIESLHASIEKGHDLDHAIETMIGRGTDQRLNIDTEPAEAIKSVEAMMNGLALGDADRALHSESALWTDSEKEYWGAVKAGGFDLRKTRIGQEWSREVRLNTSLKAQYQARRGYTEQRAFRQQWAKEKAETATKVREQEDIWKTEDFSEGVYRPLKVIYDMEGGDAAAARAASNLAKACIAMGPKFYAFNPLTRRVEFWHPRRGSRETYSRMWSIKTTEILGRSDGKDLPERALVSGRKRKDVGTTVGETDTSGGTVGGVIVADATGEDCESEPCYDMEKDNAETPKNKNGKTGKNNNEDTPTAATPSKEVSSTPNGKKQKGTGKGSKGVDAAALTPEAAAVKEMRRTVDKILSQHQRTKNTVQSVAASTRHLLDAIKGNQPEWSWAAAMVGPLEKAIDALRTILQRNFVSDWMMMDLGVLKQSWPLDLIKTECAFLDDVKKRAATACEEKDTLMRMHRARGKKGIL